jgi:hypothetical protein
MSEFNTKEFAWHNTEVSYLGRKITGIRGVKYKTSKDKEAMYARGNKPHSIQHGNKSYEGEVKLLQSEIEALNKAAKDRGYDDLTDISINIAVAYVPKNLTESAKISTRKIIGVDITEYEEGMEQGDKFAEISLPFLALDIK